MNEGPSGVMTGLSPALDLSGSQRFIEIPLEAALEVVSSPGLLPFVCLTLNERSL